MQKALQMLGQLGQNIRKIRKSKHITQQKLANKCGLDRSYISSIETGKKNISTLRLFKIAQTLNVHICDFFEKI